MGKVMKLVILMKNLTVLAALIFVTVSCSKFELRPDIAEYGTQLPNYCKNDENSIRILELETKKYGEFLAQGAYYGEWDGLLYNLMQHHFIWGNYKRAVAAGSRYIEKRGTDGITEFYVAQFLIQNHRPSDLSIKQKPLFQYDTPIRPLVEQLIRGFDQVETIAEFESWSHDSMGIDLLLVITAKILRGDVSKTDREASISALMQFFTEGDRLDRFFELTNEVGSWPWDKWLNASLLLENHAVSENETNLVADLRSTRTLIAGRMLERDHNLPWVYCVLEERGVFAGFPN